ncbi:MAG TPA: hypothetical protein PKL45_12810 [Bacteroidia bacterium]|nr:hypothetical protein [Bacteroidia bacterium]
MIHSIVLKAYTGKGRIHSKCDYYGWFWNRLKLRWIGIPNNYQLQIRTSSNFGPDARIVALVNRLIEDEFGHIE